jgi:futalosine hydrolase
MANILIVSATLSESAFLRGNNSKKCNFFPAKGNVKHSIDVLVTGPGIVATTYQLTKLLAQKKYDLAINIGICGSLDPGIKPVKVVNIISDQFGDFGAEDGKNYLDAFQLGLASKNEGPFKNGKVNSTFKQKLSCINAIPISNGITVQKVQGSTATVRKTIEKFGPVMESMEGAAFLYVCSMEKVPSLQIRAVSNMVERRNRSSWKIKEAIDALEGFTGLLLMELEYSL